jgi:hypothetical protein
MLVASADAHRANAFEIVQETGERWPVDAGLAPQRHLMGERDSLWRTRPEGCRAHGRDWRQRQQEENNDRKTCPLEHVNRPFHSTALTSCSWRCSVAMLTLTQVRPMREDAVAKRGQGERPAHRQASIDVSLVALSAWWFSEWSHQRAMHSLP